MGFGSKTVSTFFAVVSLSISMVSANMKLLISIRERLNDLRSANEISRSQYSYIVKVVASDEILDADFNYHDMAYVRPSLSESTIEFFRGWVNQEESKGKMTEDTSDLIRNIFELGYSPNRHEEESLIRHKTVVDADYEGNGIVTFIGRSGTFAKSKNRLYNGIWGYKKGNREYALQCNSIGLNIIDVTDKPKAGAYYPVIQTIEMSGGDIWRDVATKGDYAYVAAQGGISPNAFVVDLSQLSGGAPQVAGSNPIGKNKIKNLGFTGEGHTVNVGLGLLFYNNANYGCLIFDLKFPMNPRLLTTTNTGDCHDSYAQNIGGKDILFSSNGYRGKWAVIDITNIRQTKQFTKLGETSYQSGAYAHQSIASEDGKTLFVTEEFNVFDMAVYDITDLRKPKLISKFQWSGEQSEGNSVVHNAGAVIGNYLLVAYYNAGLRVFDISNVRDIKEVGKYETYRDPNGDGKNDIPINGSYHGAWNIATLPSGKILVSDSKNGTFVVELKPMEIKTGTPSMTPTLEPTTLEPTTLEPTTLEPTTLAPTTLAPTTLAPTTLAPSAKPTITLRCKFDSVKKCMRGGCAWTDPKGRKGALCKPCSEVKKAIGCTKNGCFWHEAKKTCLSCSDQPQQKCAKNGCIWDDKREVCKSCASMRAKPGKCKAARCAYHISTKNCTPCSTLKYEKVCKTQKGCLWKVKKGKCDMGG